MAGPVRARTYKGVTAAEAARKFEADDAVAAEDGWYPSSQSWEASSLTVIYEMRAPKAAESDAGRSRTSIYVPAAAVGIGGVLVAVGSTMPWVRAGIAVRVGHAGRRPVHARRDCARHDIVRAQSCWSRLAMGRSVINAEPSPARSSLSETRGKATLDHVIREPRAVHTTSAA